MQCISIKKMKISVYRVDRSKCNTVNDIEKHLSENKYSKIVTSHKVSEYNKQNINAEIWIEQSSKDELEWQKEIATYISSNLGSSDRIFTDLGSQYNCILILSCNDKLPIYVAPFGKAYTVIHEITDRDFGLDFGSKIFDKNSLNIVSRDKYNQNALKELTNYKVNSTIQATSSESFELFKGKPLQRFQPDFGKSVSCGKSIVLNNYTLDKFLKAGSTKIFEAESLPDILKIPRVKRIKKNDPLTKALNEALLSQVITGKKNIPQFEIIGYIIEDDEIIFIEENLELIFLASHKKKSELILNSKESKVEQIRDYIVNKHNDPNFENFESLLVVVNDQKDYKREKKLLDIMRVELDFNGTTYILTDGYWATFNDTYVDLLNKSIDEIKLVFGENLNLGKPITCTKSITAAGKTEIREDDYIDKFRTEPNYEVIHPQLTKPKSTSATSGIEICDIVYENKKHVELISIKKGLDSTITSYCFSQSILSLEILKNPNSFDLTTPRIKRKYLSPKFVAVSLILPLDSSGSPVSDTRNTKKVLAKTFKLSDLKSLMLKNKIFEWSLAVSEVAENSKIYLDTPVYR